MTAAANSRQSSITLAPEAATQRMRDIICKTITGEMIEGAVEAAFKAGYTSLKTYFMIGLPRETHAEVQGIVDLGIRAREIGREIKDAAGASACTSASRTSSPSPTPHSSGRACRAVTSSRRSRRTCGARCPTRQIRLSMHDRAHLDARGRARHAAGSTRQTVIEHAWRNGARFDAWTEMFQEQAWHDAFTASGTTMDAEATREFGEWDELPWDHVQSGVSTEFLLDQWQQSKADRATGDCRGRLRRLWRRFGPVRNKLVR